MKENMILRAVIVVFAAVVLLIGITVLLTSCKSSSSGGAASEDLDEYVADPDKAQDEVIDSVVPDDDFHPAGEYEDETSQRASMRILSDDGEDCKVLIIWGSSATETTAWQFEGKFDRKSGMIPYENCIKTNLSWDEDGNESEEVVYKDGKGALLYYKNGFHWDDKKEDAGKDCYFVKPE